MISCVSTVVFCVSPVGGKFVKSFVEIHHIDCVIVEMVLVSINGSSGSKGSGGIAAAIVAMMI